ncbi:ABC transporter ATP-binding protein [Candidatus Puniceispirillum sp.]|nr:ABC transporter ATP-binding protein [Candidatus Puniceispirillum sp.]
MNKLQEATDSNPLLELRGVTQSFFQGLVKLDILVNANLSVHAGEMKALIGPSGSGKSTLLNIAGLLEQPDSGLVLIDGVEANSLGRSKRALMRRTDIGFVFQFHRLLPEFSASENIMIPQMLAGLDRFEAAARADQLLAMVGLQARADHRPGLLSGGEQQRVAIARSVANAPRVLLADEPTGNLDPDTAKEVFQHLSSITRATGTAALVVTHNQQLALNMDSVLTIENGQVIPIG